MVLNRVLIRTLEGYNTLMSILLRNRQLKLFDRLKEEIKLVEQRGADEKSKGPVSKETEKRYMNLQIELRTKFPVERDEVLPTSFGNRIRAFEVYSRVVYGLDAIPVWTRIIAVVPSEARDGVNNSKAQVDFAVNSMYLTLVLFIEYVSFVAITKTYPMWFILIPILIMVRIYYYFAVSSAIEWGEYVKAIFDLYRNHLLSQMGIEIPKDYIKEKELWRKINKTMIYEDALDVERDFKK